MSKRLRPRTKSEEVGGTMSLRSTPSTCKGERSTSSGESTPPPSPTPRKIPKKIKDYVTYHFFKFDVNILKEEVQFPASFAQGLPAVVYESKIREYLPRSLQRKGAVFSLDHEKRVGFRKFNKREACSSRGPFSIALAENLRDRLRLPGGYVSLPPPGMLRAAEVFDGGLQYSDTATEVECADPDGTLRKRKLIITDITTLGRSDRSNSPPHELERTMQMTTHIREYVNRTKTPLSIVTEPPSTKEIFRFSGGGDVTITSSLGVMVIGGPDLNVDADVVTLKDGDVPVTSNVENKLGSNPTSYQQCELQLFANMHLSACRMLHSSIIQGEIDPSRIKRLIAYGSVLKPGANIVALYKLVAEFNKETYVQMDYCVETIHWHSVFDSILLYTFKKLCQQ